MFYDENGSLSKGYTEFSDLIYVKPGVVYDVKLELLRSDLADPIGGLTEMTIDGENVGGCKPPGNKNDCDFFECGQGANKLDIKEVSTSSRTLSFNLKYGNNSQVTHCKCDKTTWKCHDKANNDYQGLPEIVAAARITLFPKLHYSGKIYHTV